MRLAEVASRSETTMFNSMFKKTSTALVALLTAFAVTTATVPASAQQVVQGTVPAIELNLVGTNNILRVNVLSAGATTQYVSDTHAPCNAATVDDIKMYQSVAQAALLSGKKINILFGACPGSSVNYIQFIDLIQ
jgi:hypothetical protein